MTEKKKIVQEIKYDREKRKLIKTKRKSDRDQKRI